MGNNTVKFQSQIDLVVAAQAEYDFLRLIDKHPVLYKSNVIYNAIYRYELDYYHQKWMYKLPHELSNDLRIRILGN